MTSPAQHHPFDTKTQFPAALKDHYLSQGFTFEIEPDAGRVPSFLGDYRPDAIASKPGSNIVIEVRQRQTLATDVKLKEIRRLFDGHPDWTFVVAYASEDPFKSLTISASPVSEIRKRLGHVRTLEAKGEVRGAFILGWSLLEATLNNIESSSSARPRTPGTVIQRLAMLGYIDSEVERKVRALIPLRNRVVHGDLVAEPLAVDVELILSTVEKTLMEAGA